MADEFDKIQKGDAKSSPCPFLKNELSMIVAVLCPWNPHCCQHSCIQDFHPSGTAFIFLQFGVLFLLESARLSIFLSTCGFKKCVVILSCVVTHSMNCLLCLVINST